MAGRTPHWSNRKSSTQTIIRSARDEEEAYLVLKAVKRSARIEKAKLEEERRTKVTLPTFKCLSKPYKDD